MSSRPYFCQSRPKALCRRVKRKSYAISSIICSGALLVAPVAANANPQDGQLTAGTATITQTSTKRLDIDQQSQKAIINWKFFSIGEFETTNFNQPNASSITLNRVTGADPSSILGSLTANGQVWLVNPNGIVFGKTARVDVSGLLATTLDINDNDFMSGHYKFSSGGNGAMVVNEGEITVRQAGLASLVAPGVENSGIIQANLGHVQLSSAAGFTLDLYGDGIFNFLLDEKVTEAVIAYDGSKPAAAVANSGQLIADGGKVVLSANVAKSVIDHAINMDGLIQATSVKEANGEIILHGGSEGVVEVSGTLDASAPNSGDGGFIETSGAFVQVADTATVTTAAADGRTGTWLIDPNDFTVAATGGNITGTALSASLANNSVTISTATQGTTGGNGDIFVNAPVSWGANTTLALAAERNIEVNANMTATGNTAGLTLGYGSGGEYTIASGKRITLPGSTPVLKIGTAGSEQTYIVINSLGVEGDTSTTTLQGMKNNLSGLYALGSDIDASATSGWNSGAGFLPVGSYTYSDYFTGIFDGLGHTVTGLTINRPTEYSIGLFGQIYYNGIVRNVGLLGGSVTGYGGAGGLAGSNHGTITNSYSTGSVTGDLAVGGLVGENNAGHISNSYSASTVTGISASVGGLVGMNNNYGTITNSYSAGSVTGNLHIGGLVGYSSGTISNSYSTGAVIGENFLGGLVGQNYAGTISDSYSTGTVTGNDFLGGLAGINYFGLISNSYSTGTVMGHFYVGGLVGQNCSATISNSYSIGTVNGSIYVGGLVGTNTGEDIADGSISNSYSTGIVTGNSHVGGLVGDNTYDFPISNSYWDTETSGQSMSAGGTGLTTAQLKSGLPVGFDSSVWAISADVNSGYPYLQWQGVSAPEPTPEPEPTPAPEPRAPTTVAQIKAIEQSSNVRPESPNLQKELDRAQKREASFPGAPEYLYEAGIPTAWMKATGAITDTKDLKKLYDEIYLATLEYRKLARLYLDNANSALENKDAALAQYYLDKHDRYIKILQYGGEAALITYDGNLEAAKEFTKGIQKGSVSAVKFGTIFVASPVAGAFLNTLAASADFTVNWSENGVKFAVKEASKEVLKEIILHAVMSTPVKVLGNKSLASYVENAVKDGVGSSVLYPVLNTFLDDPASKKAIMKFAAESLSNKGVNVTQDLAERMYDGFHPDFSVSSMHKWKSTDFTPLTMNFGKPTDFTPLTTNFGKPAVNIFDGSVGR